MQQTCNPKFLQIGSKVASGQIRKLNA